MKRICFVTMGNVYTVPYLSTYTRHIEGSYSLIYWDREGKNESGGDNTYYRFYKEIDPTDRVKKLAGYLQYRNYVKTILKKERFDLVVFLQTWSALLLSDVVKKHYAGRFVVDVRDYTYEKNPLIYGIEKRLFPKARACFISSEGYKKFLPPHTYHVLHNTRDLPREQVDSIQERPRQKDTLHISFIGYVNYQEQHKKLLLSLKNDSRFHLHFTGTRALELEPFCAENGIRNVTLTDTFDPAKTLDFYEDADFVNNLYGNNTPTLDYALSNKLYFAAALHMPILTCADTFMSEISHQYGFGVDLDVSDRDAADRLWAYYRSLDWDALRRGCDAFMNKVTVENNESHTVLKQILS